MQDPQMLFCFQPTAKRLEKLLRDQIREHGKVKTFKKSEEYIFTYAGGYTTLSNDNIDVLLSVQDNKIMIIEWSNTTNAEGIIEKEYKTISDLDNYKLILELAIYLQSTHNKG